MCKCTFLGRPTMLLAAAIMMSLATWADVPEYKIKSERAFDGYTSLVIEYTSLSADSKGEQTVSGIITLPAAGMPKATVLESHFTITKDSQCPSVSGSSDGAPLMAKDYCIVSTDYIGYGSTKKQNHPYLCQQQNAINAIDLALVARDVLEKRGVKPQYDLLFNVGYSQGGGVAMAVHREMELHPELAEELHFYGSWCGGGPYDVRATVEHYLDHPDDIDSPILLPLLIKGLLTGVPDAFSPTTTFKTFFRPKLISAGLESWIDSKSYDSGDISRMMTNAVGSSSLGDIFTDEILSRNSDIYREMETAIDAVNILDGWKPTFPLHTYHLSTDRLVPIINSERAAEALELTEDQQTVVTLPVIEHSSCGYLYYINTVNEMAEVLENATSISEAVMPDWKPQPTPAYNLMGQPVNGAYKGLIIRDGKVTLKH